MRPDGIGNGGVIVDVGLWDFLEVSYRPKAAVELNGKLSFNVELTGAARIYRTAPLGSEVERHC